MSSPDDIGKDDALAQSMDTQRAPADTAPAEFPDDDEFAGLPEEEDSAESSEDDDEEEEEEDEDEDDEEGGDDNDATGVVEAKDGISVTQGGGNVGNEEDGDEIPHFGSKSKGKKRSLRKAAAPKEKKAKKEKAESGKRKKKGGLKRYVDDAAVESDESGGVVEGRDDDDEEDDEDEDDEEMASFVGTDPEDEDKSSDSSDDSDDSDAAEERVRRRRKARIAKKKLAKKAKKAKKSQKQNKETGGEDEGSKGGDSDEDSDEDSEEDDSDEDSDESDMPRKRSKLRKVAHREKHLADEDDLLLIAEGAAEGIVTIDNNVRRSLAQLQKKRRNDGDADVLGSLDTEKDGAIDNDVIDEGPVVPSAFEKDIDEDEMDDFIVDDLQAQKDDDKADDSGLRKRRRRDDNVPEGYANYATQEELSNFNDLFGLSLMVGGGQAADSTDVAEIFGEVPASYGIESASSRRSKKSVSSAVSKLREQQQKMMSPSAADKKKSDQRSSESLTAEPALISQHYLTSTDDRVRTKDEPERLQLWLRSRRQRRQMMQDLQAKASQLVAKSAEAVNDAETEVKEAEQIASASANDASAAPIDSAAELESAAEVAALTVRTAQNVLKSAKALQRSVLKMALVRLTSAPAVESMSLDGEVKWIASRLYQPKEASLTDPYSDLNPSTALLNNLVTPRRDAEDAIRFVLTKVCGVNSSGAGNKAPSEAGAADTTVDVEMDTGGDKFESKSSSDELLEVPFVWTHCRDELAEGFTAATLWSIVDLDDVWTRWNSRRLLLASAVDRACGIDGNEEARILPENRAESVINSLLLANSERAVDDAAGYLELLAAGYSSLNKRLTTGALSQSSLVDTPVNGALDLRGAGGSTSLSRNDLNGYRQAFGNMVNDVTARIFLSAEQVAGNLRTSNDRVNVPPMHTDEQRMYCLDGGLSGRDAELAADERCVDEATMTALGEGIFETSGDVLRSARLIAAADMAREPYIRSIIRRSFYREVSVSTSPTVRGKSDIDAQHPYYGIHTLKDKRLHDFVEMSPIAMKHDSNDAAEAWSHIVDEGYPDLPTVLGEKFPGPDALKAHLGYGLPLARSRLTKTPGGVLAQLPPAVGGPTQFALLLKAQRDGYITISINIPQRWSSSQIALLCKASISNDGFTEARGDDESLRKMTFSSELDRQRLSAAIFCIDKLLQPELVLEAKALLESAANDAIAGEFANRLRELALCAPIRAPPHSLVPKMAEKADFSLKEAERALRAAEAELRKMDDANDIDEKHLETLKLKIKKAELEIPIRKADLAKAVREAKDSDRVAAEYAAPYPWIRQRLRVLAVANARPGSEEADVAVVLDPKGDVLEFKVLPRSSGDGDHNTRKDRRKKVLYELFFRHNPSVVVLSSSGGLRSTRELKAELVEASVSAAMLVKIARTNWKIRKDLARQYRNELGPNANEGGNDKDPNVKAQWRATYFNDDPGLEAAADAWRRSDGEFRFFLPRLPGHRFRKFERGLKTEVKIEPYHLVVPNGAEESTGTQPTLPIVFLPTEDLAAVYSRSPRANADGFGDYAPGLRFCISLGRFAQDPLGEICHLYASQGDVSLPGLAQASEMGVASLSSDLLTVPLHSLQSEAPQHMLLAAAERVLVEAVASTGLDLNSILSKSHLSSALQFVPGLGPRKAIKLKLDLRGQRLSTRHDLLSNRKLGPNVYKNVASFLRVCESTHFTGPSYGTRLYVADPDNSRDKNYDPLDATRIHPQHYWAARLLAQTRMDLAMRTGLPLSVEPLPHNRSKAETFVKLDTEKWLSLPAFWRTAEQSFDNDSRPQLRAVTDVCQRTLSDFLKAKAIPFESWKGLYDEQQVPNDGLSPVAFFADKLKKDLNVKMRHILESAKMELRCPYREARRPIGTPSIESNFRILIGEPSSIVRQGALFDVVVKRINAPIPNKTGSARIEVEMDSGLRGSIRMRALDLGTPPVDHMDDAAVTSRMKSLYKEGSRIIVKISKLEREHLNFEASNLVGDLKKARPPIVDRACDTFLAANLEEATRLERDDNLAKAKESAGAVNSSTNRGYEERAIAHPGFKNMSRLEAEAYLADKDVWSCVIRPSSKGLSHLTLTWKIAESRDFRPDSMLDSDVVAEAKAVCAHIDIEEEEKDSLNLRALGQKLIVDRRQSKTPNEHVSHTPNADGYVYGSLDELLVRHVDPMAQQHKALRASKVYLDASLEAVYGELKRLLKEKPGSAPYFVSPDLEQIGFYKISYILRSKPHSETIKVVPGGLLYKSVISSDWRRMIDDFKARVRVNPKEDAARAAAEKANLAKLAASKSATGATSVAPLGSSRSVQQITQAPSYGASLFPYGGGAGQVSASSASAAAGPSRNSRWASAASTSSISAPIAPAIPSVIGYDVNWGTSAYGVQQQNYSHPSSQTPSMGGISDWRSSASQIQPQIMQHNQQPIPVYGSFASMQPPMQQQQQQQYQPMQQPQQQFQYQGVGAPPGVYPGLQWNQQQPQQQPAPSYAGGYGIPQQQQHRGGSGRY